MEPKYIVVEIQTSDAGVVSTIVNSYDGRNAAEAKFHTILASAAASSVAKHAAIMFSEEGFPLRHECYTHIVEEEEA